MKFAQANIHIAVTR